MKTVVLWSQRGVIYILFVCFSNEAEGHLFCCSLGSFSVSWLVAEIQVTSSSLTFNRLPLFPFPFPPLPLRPELWSYQWLSDILWEVVETWSESCFPPRTQSHSSGLLWRTEAAGEPLSLFKISLCPVRFFACPFPSLGLSPSLGRGFTVQPLLMEGLLNCKCQRGPGLHMHKVTQRETCADQEESQNNHEKM